MIKLKEWADKNLQGDKVIWAVVFALSIISVMVVYSSIGTLAYKRMASPESYLLKHTITVLVGLSAPFIAFYMSRNPSRKKIVGVTWNILGLDFLINIVTIAILSAPTPFRIFMNEPANTIIAGWPFIWLPGFVVPAAFMLHIFSLKQLLTIPKAGQAASQEHPIVI